MGDNTGDCARQRRVPGDGLWARVRWRTTLARTTEPPKSESLRTKPLRRAAVPWFQNPTARWSLSNIREPAQPGDVSPSARGAGTLVVGEAGCLRLKGGQQLVSVAARILAKSLCEKVGLLC